MAQNRGRQTIRLKLQNILRVPENLDREKAQRAELLQRAILVTAGLFTFFGILFYVDTVIPGVTFASVVVIDLGLVWALLLLRRGRVTAAGWVYTVVNFVCITYIIVFVHGTSSSPVVGFYIVLTVLSTFLLGIDPGLFMGLVSFAILAAIITFEEQGWLPKGVVVLTHNNQRMWYALIFLASILVVRTIMESLQGAFKRAEERERELTWKNEELQEIRYTLEDRVTERTQEILREKQLFEALFTNSPVAIVFMDMQGRVTMANPAFEHLFGYRQTEVIGEKLDDLVADPDFPDEPHQNTLRTLRGELVIRQGRRRTKDGRSLWVEVRGLPVITGDLPVGLLAIYYDLTDQKKAQEELRASEKEYRSLFENVMDGVYRTSVDGRFLTANPAVVRMLGYDSLEELLALDIARDVYVDPQDRQRLMARQNIEGVTRNAELRLKRKDGSILYVLENSFVVRDETGAIAYYEGTLTDITDLKEAEKRIYFMATHDALTGLPNRTFFFDNLNNLIQRTGGQHKIAVVFIDLDGFKEVNDHFGHARGDLLLQQVSKLMAAAIRPCDMIARLGGDEFAFYFDQVTSAAKAVAFAEQVQASLDHDDLVLEVEGMKITSSIGIALYPEDGSEAETLLRRADQAMYRVKEEGKNNIKLYSA